MHEEKGEAVSRLQRALHEAIDKMRDDLDRVEILTAAIGAFSRPVPDYEPAFRHLHRLPLSAFELDGDTPGH